MAIQPPVLRPGDTIGVVTLGSPEDPAIIDERVATLREMGFRVILGEHVYAQNGFLAGTPGERATDLMNMFANDDVRVIMPTRGGVGVAAILPYLDYAFIQQHPKIVTGYSDITVLLNVLSQFTGLITFHSIFLINFRANEPAYNFDQFFGATSTLRPTWPIMNPPQISQTSLVPGNVSGPIVGGNITSFVDTLGTPYEIDTRGKILFLEDVNEPINSLYRYLNHLYLAGKFHDCVGIVMGECTDCPPAYGVTYEQLINEFLVPLGKPLMTNVTTGHGPYKATIPIGAIANVNTINNTFTTVEPVVRPTGTF